MRAYAKINLILDVLEKRADGYHNIDFLMTCVDLYDEVEVIKNSENDIEVIGNEKLSNKDNLAYKALMLLDSKFSLKNKYKIIIKKNIPVAAGMAGGSTDCAAVLKLINIEENLQLSLEDLVSLGMELGSDVGFCIYSKLAHVEGIGEKISIIDRAIPKSSVLVINPGIELSTKKVYESYIYEYSKKVEIENIIKYPDYEQFYSSLRNDLEKVSVNLEKSIPKIKEDIFEICTPTKVMLSGSGPTLLVFDKDDKLNLIKNKLLENIEYEKYYIKIHNIL